MKALLPLFFLFTATVASAQNPRADNDCADISLSPDTLNLGKVQLNATVCHSVTIKNTGKCPLIISNILGGTSREFACNKFFYQPGETGTLAIIYVAEKPQTISQVLTIYSNAKQSMKTLIIIGEVVNEGACAQLTFDKDTIDLGNIPYLFGKHYKLNVYNKGSCPVLYQAAPGDDILNMLGYTNTQLNPKDTGYVDFHVGGQFAGNYYGQVRLSAVNIPAGQKTLYLKAKLLPPEKKDTNETTISVDKDMFDFGTVLGDSNADTKPLTGFVKITNTGKKPLIITVEPSKTPHVINLPEKPIQPGQSVTLFPVFYAGSVPDSPVGSPPYMQHVIISGNFPGKHLPLYGRWYYKSKKK